MPWPVAIFTPRGLPSFQRRKLPSKPPVISSPFFSSTRLHTMSCPVAIFSPRGLPSFQRRKLPSSPPLISSPFVSSTRLRTLPCPVAIFSPRGLPSFQRLKLPSKPLLISSPFLSSISLITLPWPVGMEPICQFRVTASASVFVKPIDSPDLFARRLMAARPFTTASKGSMLSWALAMATNARSRFFTASLALRSARC